MSRTDRARASNRSRIVADARSTPVSNSRCRSYSASLVLANCTGPQPYRVFIKVAGSGHAFVSAIALVAILLSSNDSARHFGGLSRFDRISWRDLQNARLPDASISPNHRV